MADNSVKAVFEWQQRLASQPHVWWLELWDENGWEPTGAYYTSREAAAFEAEWWLKKRNKKTQMRCANLHDEQLSRERWT
jgi:hypothetical protein